MLPSLLLPASGATNAKWCCGAAVTAYASCCCYLGQLVLLLCYQCCSRGLVLLVPAAAATDGVDAAVLFAPPAAAGYLCAVSALPAGQRSLFQLLMRPAASWCCRDCSYQPLMPLKPNGAAVPDCASSCCLDQLLLPLCCECCSCTMVLLVSAAAATVSAPTSL